MFSYASYPFAVCGCSSRSVLVMRSVTFDRFPSVRCFSYVPPVPLSSNSVLILLFFLEILYPESAYSVGTFIYLMLSLPNSYLTVSIPGISSINEVVFVF